MAAGGIAGIEDELEQQLAQLQLAVAQAQQRQVRVSLMQPW